VNVTLPCIEDKLEHCDGFVDGKTCTTSSVAVVGEKLVKAQPILAEEQDFSLLLYCCFP
jgi:hypothetical protein